MTLAARFRDRFAGLDRAHGRYTIKGTKGRKVDGAASLVREPLTTEAWTAHLGGKVGVGVVPIRDDATCRWGAIDVDDYDVDHDAIERAARGLKFPLVVCRSKSGGAHLFLFLSEPVPAELVRAKLMEMALALGFAGVEVFPKQAKLASKKDFGSWLNMPYFDAAQTARYATWRGKALGAEAFLDYAGKVALDEVALTALRFEEEPLLVDGPPCLQVLARTGFPEGSRNHALFDAGVYFRKRFGDENWGPQLDEFNRRFVRPALGHSEVSNCQKSVMKKNYVYRCKEQPIVAVCNRAICLTRKYGISGASDDPGVTFGTMLKLTSQPPMYIWDVNGERLELTADELMTQRKFHRVCFERLDRWPSLVPERTWMILVQQRLDNLEYQETPEDTSADGIIWQVLEDFCALRPHGRSRDELLQGLPYTEKGVTHFRSSDLLRYIEQQRIRGYSQKRIWLSLRRGGALYGRWTLKGREVKWWSVPAFGRETEPLDVPRRTDEEDF